ncbi:hypothetical protein Bbelb_084340 [Branchiostoma belcheri]|nr:hypothetical protein Bbelb_084340 [Branchiostoma belcheri]
MLQNVIDIQASPHMITWIHSYLGGRCERVVVKIPKEPTPGVPQGIVLSPFLFLLFMASTRRTVTTAFFPIARRVLKSIGPSRLTLGGAFVPWVYSANGLGFILDKNLTLQEQVTSMQGNERAIERVQRRALRVISRANYPPCSPDARMLP